MAFTYVWRTAEAKKVKWVSNYKLLVNTNLIVKLHKPFTKTEQ